MPERSAGHTVLAVPVAVLDEVVRERTAHYDASFVSRDPSFVHAHITVLAPWVPGPSEADLARVANIARGTTPFEVELADLGVFPDGVVHLRPAPDTGLRALTRRFVEAFPDHPPYDGRYGDVAPHLTLDRVSPDVTPESVRDRVAHLVPTTVPVERIDLQWWANHDCRTMGSFPLGS